MLDINQLKVFIQVVDEGSFTAAGKTLGMPKSRVSRMVSDLEASLGSRLLQRSTRQLSLTEVGNEYYSRCRHLIHEITEAHRLISDREHNPHGVLRLVVPVMVASGSMGHFLTKFQNVYPDVRIEVVHTDRPVNMIQEGYDLGIFVGDLPDSSLIARTLTESDSILCASPAYLKEYGQPQHPQDLKNLRCVKLGDGIQPETYQMIHSETGEEISIAVEPNITTNLMEANLHSMIKGAGIGRIPYLMAGDAVLSGQLIPIFNDWQLRPERVSVAYPSRQYLPKKVRSFVDFIVSEVEELNRLIDALPTTEEQLSAVNKLLSQTDET
ncbi:LysR family transcriptional regulator [Bacterioplanoides sp.]|uniref:LysR family transcriptional regulator n=1 Tax=Bacterioplanoides sp. TaxID=2066072 RepID=UPI003B001071